MTHRKIEAAIEAFADVERVELLLEKKQAILSYWTQVSANDPSITAEDRDEYFRATEQIRIAFEAKRGKVKVGPKG